MSSRVRCFLQSHRPLLTLHWLLKGPFRYIIAPVTYSDRTDRPSRRSWSRQPTVFLYPSTVLDVPYLLENGSPRRAFSRFLAVGYLFHVGVMRHFPMLQILLSLLG